MIDCPWALQFGIEGENVFYLLWKKGYYNVGRLNPSLYDQFVNRNPEQVERIVDVIVINGVEKYMKSTGKSSIATEMLALGYVDADYWRKRK